MPAGLEKWDDGLYGFQEISDALDQSFKSEKDLCQFIEINIDKFTEELGYAYQSHEREYPIQGTRRQIKGTKRIDFLIKTQCGKALAIECKHPKYKCELSAGVGQILSYITIAEQYNRAIDGFYMVSSVLDYVAPSIIAKFDLPIIFIAMDKTKSLTWQRQKETSIGN